MGKQACASKKAKALLVGANLIPLITEYVVMSKFLARLLRILLLASCILVTTTTAQAHECYLTEKQINEINFHYDLDWYMVGGCVVGAVFGSVTGLLTMSGVTIVAAVPYVATGCSTGFLLGGATAMLNAWLTPPRISTESSPK